MVAAAATGGRGLKTNSRRTEMLDVFLFGGMFAAGYVLSIYTWPALRTFLVGLDQELAWLKARADEVEEKLRVALSRFDR
jgi:hypothetical protein